MIEALAVTAFCLAILLCAAVSLYCDKSIRTQAEMEILRRDELRRAIQRAERSHAPRKSLRRQLVEAKRQQIESELKNA